MENRLRLFVKRFDKIIKIKGTSKLNNNRASERKYMQLLKDIYFLSLYFDPI